MNDILYFKVFRNIYLFNKIYSFVVNSRLGYYKIHNFSLYTIYRNEKLFKLKYSSWIYNKEIGDGYKSMFGNQFSRSLISFLKSSTSIINIQQFKELYQVYYKDIRGITRTSIMEQVIQSYSIERVEFLIEFYGFKFDKNKYQHYIQLLCCNGENGLTIEYLNFIKSCFIKHSLNLNHNRDNRKPQIDNQVELFKFSKLGYLISICSYGNCEKLFKSIWDSSIDQINFHSNLLVNMIKDNGGNGEDQDELLKRMIGKSKIKILISRFVSCGSIGLLDLVVSQFSGTKLLKWNNLISNVYLSKSNSLKCLIALILNDIIVVDSKFSINSFNFIQKSKLQDIMPLLNYFQEKKIKLSPDQLVSVEDLDCLKYLMENKSLLGITKISSYSLMYNASVKNPNLEMVKFLVKQFNETPRGTDTTFEIAKYFLESFPHYIWNDINFECAFVGDIEYVKYLVGRYKTNPYQIQLSFRSLDRACLNGHSEIIKYLLAVLDTLPVITISRDAINNAIKSGDLKSVQLLKNTTPTKPGDKKLLFDTSMDYIFLNKRTDILLTLFDSGYRQILVNYFLENNYKIGNLPENLKIDFNLK